MWQRTLRVVPAFPLWGTGLGTFRYVELWQRGTTPLNPDAARQGALAIEPVVADHAHNDFVEILIEAGVPGPLTVLAMLVFVYRSGLRAAWRRDRGRTASLALGGVCGLTAVVVHSLVDFGMRAPAIALLTTVVCAALCAAGGRAHGAGGTAEPT